ncbi:CBS domain-containing protein [Clostridium tyrobutyricum]|uniref:CBS domain-containing protein n=1 Tax=Clostridium tyrobutyricum TaxID=1519 RepID=UPI001C388AC8|nr:CBS domain-containing protein [Clostridium tyrobutyricum]MBV4419456.1 CBS domain-containing protein [Clostridium tyrobutyricum]
MIGDIMRSDIVRIKDTDILSKALNIMHEHKINGAPVINENGKLVGMIVKADIYRFLMEEGHFDTCPVEWVMSKQVITAHKDEAILSAAKRLRENNIIAIPVVDNDLIVEGIISIEDIIDYIIKKSSK